MGKYNFNYERISKLEAENAQLREKAADCEELKKRIEALEKLVSEKKKTKDIRTFLGFIENEKALELFAVAADKNGNIVQTGSGDDLHSNFTTFKQNILKLIMPKAYRPPASDKWYVRYARLEDLNDEEYQIVGETFQSITDTLLYAKNKLKKAKEGKTDDRS